MCGCDAHHNASVPCTCFCHPRYHARPLKVELDQQERMAAQTRSGESTPLLTDGRALALIAVLAIVLLAVIWWVAG